MSTAKKRFEYVILARSIIVTPNKITERIGTYAAINARICKAIMAMSTLNVNDEKN